MIKVADWFQIAGRGTVAVVESDDPETDFVSVKLGGVIQLEGTFYEIRGIETRGTADPRKQKHMGLVVKPI
jgi:hypothetical protein